MDKMASRSFFTGNIVRKLYQQNSAQTVSLFPNHQKYRLFQLTSVGEMVQ